VVLIDQIWRSWTAETPAQVSRYRRTAWGSIALGTAFTDIASESRNRPHVPHTITPTMTRLVSGSLYAAAGDTEAVVAEVISFEAEPAFLSAAKIRRDFSRCDYLSGVVVCPPEEVRPRPCAGSHSALPNEPVQVQLQPILKTNPLARSRHKVVALEIILKIRQQGRRMGV
jgi:hypothetical protein